jgi:hypothetical protein
LVSGEACEKVDQDLNKFVDGLLKHLQRLTKVPQIHQKLIKTYWKNWGNERLIQAGHSYDLTTT